MDIFSIRLKLVRLERRLTQAEVADVIGMSSSGYTKIEQGHREPSLQTLVRICDVLGVSSDYLLGRVAVLSDITDNDNDDDDDRLAKILFMQADISKQIDILLRKKNEQEKEDS